MLCSSTMSGCKLLNKLLNNDDSDVDQDYHRSEDEEHTSDYDLAVGNYQKDANKTGVETEDATCKNNSQKPRKRQRNASKRATAKKLRSSGKRYVNTKVNIVEAKIFQNKSCGCSKKCTELVTEEERRKQFENCYTMGNFGQQNAYLCVLVHHFPIKQRRPRDGTKGSQQCTNTFSVQNEGSTFRVCKKFFLDTFQVSDRRITRALGNVRCGKLPGEDLRGKHVAAKKITHEQKQSVRDHINLFPAFQSHYTRKDNPNRKYLSPELNIRQMYTLYIECCKENQISPVKEYFYRTVFNNEFNLHFHVQRKDTCKLCDGYKQLIDVTESVEQKKVLEHDHLVHLVKAGKARDNLKSNGEHAKENEELYVVTVDFQKALPFIKLTVSEAYYRRNMYCYNLGIHDVANNIGFMYVWDETTASRGSQEIASCLTKHIKQNPKKHIIIYSDTCPGQNRNIKVSLSLFKLTQETAVDVIDHKFMVSGHSYLPNDADFGLIEQASRGKIIYVPDDCYKVIETSRRHNKFVVVKINADHFFKTDALEKRNNNHDVNWLNIQWLRYQKEKPLSILYKCTLSDFVPFSELHIHSNKPGRSTSLGNIIQEKLYDSARGVNYLKKRDMLYLLKYIPSVPHAFFNDIRGSKEAEDCGSLPGKDSKEDNE